MVNGNLRSARKLKRWSMQIASERIGVDRVTYSRWERGGQEPHPSTLDLLCRAFDMSPEDLGFGHLVATDAQKDQEDLAMDERRRDLFKQALQIGAALTLPALGLAKANTLAQAMSTKLSLGDSMLLEHFSKLMTICWDLLRVDGLSTVGELLPTFLPEITELVQQSPTCQKEAAGLAAQGYILAGLVATLQLDHAASEAYCKRAVLLSRVAEDRTLEAAALKHLAVKYFDLKHPRQTLQKYQEALQFVDQVSPLMQSRTYLGLAAAYAQLGQQQDALRYLGMSQETFPDMPEKDVSFTYADCGPSSLNHYGGLIYMELDQPQKAWETFAEVEKLKQRIVIPERTIIEIVNCQAEAAVAQRNLELANSHIQAGVAGALKLKSERRFADTFSVYKNMRLIWPHEPQVKALGELFLR
ncbi:MAG TPA: helix-turn-helix transcriptional regulator [Ktedonobacteraceae bacterium]